MKKILRVTAYALILAGLALFTVNLAGMFLYTTIDGDEPGAEQQAGERISARVFWEQAYRRDGEPLEDYVRRLTALVDARMIAIDPVHAKPTFFENWILWSRARRLGYHEWLDLERAVRLGGGYCSQHAIVMDSILDRQGIESRILGLNGHVLNEVLVDDAWRVADANYNVVFDASLHELEAEPGRVYQGYRAAGLEDSTARKWQDVFASVDDNWHFRSSLVYASMVYFFAEKGAMLLVWLVPAALVALGGLILLVPTVMRRLTV